MGVRVPNMPPLSLSQLFPRIAPTCELGGTFLSESTRAYEFLPGLIEGESVLSWIDRCAQLLGTSAESAFNILDQTDGLCRLVLRVFSGDRHSASALSYLERFFAGFHSSVLIGERLYCARCAYALFLRGMPYFRRESWSEPLKTFCEEDGWPLLAEPAARMDVHVKRRMWSNEDWSILRATRPSGFSTRSPLSYLDWAPLWSNVAALEKAWSQGTRTASRDAILDLAAVLCSNFGRHSSHSLLAELCVLPTDRYGERLKSPVPTDSAPRLTDERNVHVRRTAIAAAYCLAETALREHHLPTLFPESEDFVVQVGEGFWRRFATATESRARLWLDRRANANLGLCHRAIAEKLRKLPRSGVRVEA